MKIQRTYIDEQALAAMINHAPAVGLDEMQTIVPYLGPGEVVVERIRKAAETLQQRVVASGKKVARLYSKQPGGGQWQGKIDLWDVARISKQKARSLVAAALEYLLESSQLSLFQQGINLHALLWLAAAVGNGVAWVNVNVRRAHAHISFQQLARHLVSKRAELTVLDATVTREELESLFQRRFDLLDINVRWEGRRIWLRQGMGKNKTAGISDDRLEKHLGAMVAQVPADVDQALLVTHQHIEQKALETLQNLRPNVRWVATHYFASRGLNAFESCQAVLCFGVPIANPAAIMDIATALFPEDPAQQVKWQREQNEGELYQCAHRARFIRYPGRTLIVMGHYWPKHLLGEPEVIIDRRRNQHSENPGHALERIVSALDILGFVTKEVAAWVGIGAKKDENKIRETRQALRDFLAEVGPQCEDSSVPSLIYNTYIRLGTLTEDPPVLFSHRNFWGELLAKAEHDRPDMGRISVKLPHWTNSKWSHGLGSVDCARTWVDAFAETMYLLGHEVPDFDEKLWREGWSD